jgi:hypothetical protein
VLCKEPEVVAPSLNVYDRAIRSSTGSCIAKHFPYLGVSSQESFSGRRNHLHSICSSGISNLVSSTSASYTPRFRCSSLLSRYRCKSNHFVILPYQSHLTANKRMSASPSSRSQVPDRGISLASFKHVENERGFEKLPSVIPDSQVAPNEYLSQIPVKRFSVPKEEVSLSNLSEGFSFGERQPHRPGQFSQRPQVEHSQSNESSKFFPGSNNPFPRISPPNRPRPSDVKVTRSPPSRPHPPDIQVPHISTPIRPRPSGVQVTRPPPLDLPEIGLVGRQSSPAASSPSSGRDITKSPGQHDHFSPRSSGIGSQKGTPLKIVASPAVAYAESPKLAVRGTAPLATMHAPSPRTKAFSNSPQHVEISKQVEVSRQTEEEEQPVLVPESDHGKLSPITSGATHTDTC